ncbi:solute carrier organic anion transporter family member 74D-like [Sitodiplosis mosellana]|uniref:solute carrier organic anion transporter family member 74D-like n=1 Tax=Sitodiplosis mosellana TaxID=263140 RepID=UPI002444BF52|nr:solute carrier organic anion transporter family member 74D-like [Sitodiplosis mosellana]
MDRCGVQCWHPNWLRKFATTRWFMIVYGLLGTIQATSYLYFVITLTTIEKRFKIPSQTTGIILSGNEISQILLSLILTYFGGQRNRPRWIAWGVVFSALSCFILAWPHFIYGAGEEAYELTEEYLAEHKNATSHMLSKPVDFKSSKLCRTTMEKIYKCDEKFSYVPLVLIFMSQFVLGIGNTLYYSLGQSYLDDNTKQRNTPLMLAYAFSMRMIGPIVGIALAYLMMSIYIDPTLTPVIARDDPRWLGAWWLGWILLGVLMFIFAGLIGLFPKHLPKKKQSIEHEIDDEKCDQKVETVEKRSTKERKDGELKDFPKALMRLLTNKVLIFNNMSSIFYILGASGFMIFMGRVMEVQFNKTSHGGSIFTGPMTIIGTAVGLLTSGYAITKYKPPPKYLFFWNVMIGLKSMCVALLYTQLGCENGNNSLLVNGTIISCNSNCACDGVAYSPVCDRLTGTTYFSPCHRGCRVFDEEQKFYKDCSCNIQASITKRSAAEFLASHMFMESSTNQATLNGEAKPTEKRITLEDVYDEELKPDKPPHDDDVVIDGNHLYDESKVYEVAKVEANKRERRKHTDHEHIFPGACFGDCTFAYIAFSIISMFSSLMSSTGRIGNVLLNFRAVEPRDKAFAQGLSLFMVSLFALIPGPIIFGVVIDSTCLVWGYKCGRRGNCQLYDPIKFRYFLHSSAAVFTFLGAFFDLLVWYHAKDLDLYGDKTTDGTPIKPVEKEKDASPESEPLNK